MARIYFLTHPEVQFDWKIPVPEWDLSAVGRARLEKLAAQPWVQGLTHIFASTENKAVTTADRLARINRLPVQYQAQLREIDRSAAGTLAPEEYAAVTEAFFAHPEASARGWERAADAQHRIVAAVQAITSQLKRDDTAAIISHGGVGTLLLCHLKAAPIRRAEDQPSQGHYFLFDSAGKLSTGWTPIDAVENSATNS